MSKQCELILALDLPDKNSAISILNPLVGTLKWVKIGLQMYLKYGPDFVKEISNMGFKIFLDLKLYDIPNTVSSAISSLSNLPISMLTIHTSGGREMMYDAVKIATEKNPDLLLLGVTVLTSFNDVGLKETGISNTSESQVELLAKLAFSSGMKGLVCSPLEIESLRKILPDHIKLVTPGIRPLGSDSNEQKRIMTPKLAYLAGADYIVVGRPILKSNNPKSTVEEILKDINE